MLLENPELSAKRQTPFTSRASPSLTLSLEFETPIPLECHSHIAIVRLQVQLPFSQQASEMLKCLLHANEASQFHSLQPMIFAHLDIPTPIPQTI